MRHLAKLAATGLAAALLATACGATNVLQGKTPDQIIQLASSKVTGESYRMAMNGTLTVDASGIQGMPAAALNAMTSVLHDATLTGDGQVQNPQRMRIAITVSSLPDKKVVAVYYDGAYYISEDSGSTFAKVGDFNLQGLAESPDDIKALLDGATNVKDLGTTTHDGQRVEHIQATLGQNYMDQQIAKAIGASKGGLQQVFSLVKGLITVNSGNVDAYVRLVDGRAEAVSTRIAMGIDMGKLMTALLQGPLGAGANIPAITGAMDIAVATTTRFSDYGARITISKPAVDPNAPSLPNIFGGSGGA